MQYEEEAEAVEEFPQTSSCKNYGERKVHWLRHHKKKKKKPNENLNVKSESGFSVVSFLLSLPADAVRTN